MYLLFVKKSAYNPSPDVTTFVFNVSEIKCLIQIFDLDNLRILPEVLQIIILPHIRQEYMHQHIGIVHRYPLGVFQTNHMGRLFLQTLASHITDALSDGFHLWGWVPLADDEILADGAFYLSQVSDDDIATFLLLDCFRYNVYKFLHYIFNKVYRAAKVLIKRRITKEKRKFCGFLYFFAQKFW